MVVVCEMIAMGGGGWFGARGGGGGWGEGWGEGCGGGWDEG